MPLCRTPGMMMADSAVLLRRIGGEHMRHWLRKRVALHDWPLFLLTRGLCMTTIFLLAALLLRLWTGPADPWLLNWYADYVQAMAAVLLGTSLIGPLLLEDVLRGYT